MSCIRNFLIIVSLLALGGCGDGMGTVSGTVTLDGSPLAKADVAFVREWSVGMEADVSAPLQGPERSAYGRTDSSGEYSVTQRLDETTIVPGKYVVQITLEATEENPDPPVIPAKYNENSELAREVAPGPNTFDFDLNSGE